MFIVLDIFWFLIGAIFGSAANALIYRLPRGMSWTKGRSICPSCKHELKFWDLIPLLSYLILGGKCRYCKKPIGVHYFMVELVTAIAFMIIANLTITNYNFQTIHNLQLPILQTLNLCLIFWVMMIIAVMDWETKLISDSMIILLGGLITAYNLQTIYNSHFPMSNAMGILLGVGMIGGIWLLTKGRAMGSGDIELEAVLAWGLGWEKTLVGLWMAFVIGAIYGLFQIGMHQLKIRSEIAFGPFLITGAVIAFMWGDMILQSIKVQ